MWEPLTELVRYEYRFSDSVDDIKPWEKNRMKELRKQGYEEQYRSSRRIVYARAANVQLTFSYGKGKNRQLVTGSFREFIIKKYGKQNLNIKLAEKFMKDVYDGKYDFYRGKNGKIEIREVVFDF